MFLGLCKGICPQNMAKKMVQYLVVNPEISILTISGQIVFDSCPIYSYPRYHSCPETLVVNRYPDYYIIISIVILK